MDDEKFSVNDSMYQMESLEFAIQFINHFVYIV